jgi:hypothetical protein
MIVSASTTCSGTNWRERTSWIRACIEVGLADSGAAITMVSSRMHCHSRDTSGNVPPGAFHAGNSRDTTRTSARRFVATRRPRGNAIIGAVYGSGRSLGVKCLVFKRRLPITMPCRLTSKPSIRKVGRSWQAQFRMNSSRCLQEWSETESRILAVVSGVGGITDIQVAGPLSGWPLSRGNGACRLLLCA